MTIFCPAACWAYISNMIVTITHIPGLHFPETQKASSALGSNQGDSRCKRISNGITYNTRSYLLPHVVLLLLPLRVPAIYLLQQHNSRGRACGTLRAPRCVACVAKLEQCHWPYTRIAVKNPHHSVLYIIHFSLQYKSNGFANAY